MIDAITQPRIKYGLLHEEVGGVGLVYTYPDPLEFCVITRCSRIPFMYEQDSKVPVLNRIGNINGIEYFLNSLRIKWFSDLIRNSDPLEFSASLLKKDLSKLPLTKYWQGQENLRFIVQARAYQWERWHGRLAPLKLDEVKEAIIKAADIYK